jgi:hypothetical protein
LAVLIRCRVFEKDSIVYQPPPPTPRPMRYINIGMYPSPTLGDN